MIKYFALPLFFLVFTTGSALSATPTTFDEMDSDGNGFISKSEAQARDDISKNWEKADKDNNGKLDVSEFSAFEGRDMFQPAEDAEEPEPGAAPTR